MREGFYFYHTFAKRRTKVMDLLIKGGTVVTATSSFKADVAVKNGKISAIGANLKPEKKTEVVDAKGKMILPGD